MSTQVQTLLEAALELSEIEREELAERIYDSLGDPETEVDDDAWSDELKRRVDNAKSGKAEAISWDEVMKMFHDEREAETS